MLKSTDSGFSGYWDHCPRPACVPTVAPHPAVLSPHISHTTTISYYNCSHLLVHSIHPSTFATHLASNAPYGWLLPSIINFLSFSGKPSCHLARNAALHLTPSMTQDYRAGNRVHAFVQNNLKYESRYVDPQAKHHWWCFFKIGKIYICK